ncbi:MAG: cache domain-containing protein, partial [Hoeflea sp.]|nr:cache domain-containing protein [Hoeflea sp.]
MRLDRALSLISASLIAGILLAGGLVTLAGQRALLRDAQTIQIEDASTVLSTVMEQAATLSATHSEAIGADADIAGLMTSGDRAALLAHAAPLLARLDAGGGINVLHFHTPDMTSFLRVWEPDNLGQDLSTFRPMVVAVNRDRRTRKGLELGLKGLSLRAASAIETPGGLAGTVEIGVDLTALLHLAKAATGADYALFLDPAAAVRQDGTRLDGKAGLALEAATEAAFFGTLQQASAIELSRAPKFTSYKTEGRIFGVMGRPLLDYSGNLIGTIVIA